MEPPLDRPFVQAGPRSRRWYAPVVALLLVAPSVPELLTGSTPITTLFFDPPAFFLDFLGLMALYGGGALLVHEFTVRLGKGWATVLLLGAAYGIGEEGFAVHTFFQVGGPPTHAFGFYGHWGGVDWLWALGLIVFHAIYSIALPILLVGLVYPEGRDRPWLGRRGVAGAAVAYLFIVTLFALTVGHGPTPGAFAFFLTLALALIALAAWVPAGLLEPRPGSARVPPWAVMVAASLPFDVWTFIEIESSAQVVPAWAAAAVLAVAGAVGLAVVVGRAGSEHPDRTRLYLVTGALVPLFAWDVIVEFQIPGLLLVTAVYVYVLYRLRGLVRDRERSSAPVPRGAGDPSA